ncbi:MAG: hypothetical protein K2X66_12225 [Cyanobacteria bacterium]|nr:hypothetical protein [Cyanobacteriota bacterium]
MAVVKEGAELFLGLVGALGTDLTYVEQELQKLLSGLQYHSHVMKLTDVLLEYDPNLKKNLTEHRDQRIKALMDAGDALRAEKEDASAMAILGIMNIHKLRQTEQSDHKSEEKSGNLNIPLQRTAYIFHSLKHPDEAKVLKALYGDRFLLIAVFNSKKERRENLLKEILKSRKGFDKSKYTETIDSLLERDEKDDNNDNFGQNVRGLFPLADFFVSVDKKEELNKQLNRVINLLFDKPFITPTIDEYSMFMAKAVALRSSDLSRQVGAVIASEEGEILAAGCNEVPKVGGGAVWEMKDANGPKDHRDFKIGFDTSVRMKHAILCEVLDELKNHLNINLEDKNTDEIAHELLEKVLSDTRLASLLEFGRIVHAEMYAITEAAKNGVSIKDKTLYCTTFPCHMCTRHIIASGIKRVVFIEPYPKSMAYELYESMIDLDFSTQSECFEKVVFQPFIGVSPSRYFALFNKGKRKDKAGYAKQWQPRNANPLVPRFAYYFEHENQLISKFGTNGGASNE